MPFLGPSPVLRPANNAGTPYEWTRAMSATFARTTPNANFRSLRSPAGLQSNQLVALSSVRPLQIYWMDSLKGRRRRRLCKNDGKARPLRHFRAALERSPLSGCAVFFGTTALK
jgi:hypothetical protein